MRVSSLFGFSIAWAVMMTLVVLVQANTLRRLEDPQPIAPPPPCKTEDGIDYVGNDLVNKPGRYEDCCFLCWRTSGCKAWSWSNYNGGTCWLKTARGQVVRNVNVRSGVTGDLPNCQVEENVDYVGNDIGRAKSVLASGCCDACKNFNGCRAFSWSDYEGGTCWLKSRKDATIWKWGVKSAQISPNPVCNNLEYDTDYNDNDIGNKPAAQADLCCDICKNFNGCRAFSWSNHNGGTCWLKSIKGTPVKKTGVISAVVVPVTCNVQEGVDYVDNDIGNARANDVYGCCDICKNRNGCKAFSWTTQDGGTCWLKSAKGPVVNNPNVKSGWI